MLLPCIVMCDETETTKKKKKVKIEVSIVPVLIGTYTDGGASKGVYTCTIDQNSGKCGKPVLVAATGNPSYVTSSEDGRYIYAVGEYNDGRQNVSSFVRDGGTTQFKLTGKEPTSCRKSIFWDGADPCFIFYTGKQIVTANYSGGDISVFPVNGVTGSVMPQTQHIRFKCSAAGVTTHIHCVRPTPDGRYFIATDLGGDCIYRFDRDDTADDVNRKPFLSHSTQIYKGEVGQGPRHIVFSEDGRHAYLINELGGRIVVFDYHEGQLDAVQTVQADEHGGRGSADIHISPDGKFLYASHRLKNDGISIFSISRHNGQLTKVEYVNTGKHPRNFNITPNGRYMLVACRDSNEIQIFEINQSTGMITPTAHHIAVDKPVCVQFCSLR